MEAPGSQEKGVDVFEEKQMEYGGGSDNNLVYDDAEVEPEIHARTWVAMAAMLMLNMVQVFALQGPPAVVRDNDSGRQDWAF